jgi:toxin ParE1/3/4
MAHRLSRQAVADLDEIWDYLVHESGGVTIADRMIETLADRFLLLALHPRLGRARDQDLGPGRRSFPVGGHVIIYRLAGPDILVLRVVNGRRDLLALFGLA